MKGYFSLLQQKKRWIASRKWKALKIIKVLSEETGSLKDKTVLDVGCSVGVIARELSKASFFVVGVDPDKKSLKLVETEKNMEIILSSGLYLPFKAKAFDVVCCNQVIEYVANKEKFAKEIYRILKPEGICYLSAVNRIAAVWANVVRKLASSNFLMHTPFKGEFHHGNPCTYWSLKKIFHMFRINDKTPDIAKDSDAYHVYEVPKYLRRALRFTPTELSEF